MGVGETVIAILAEQAVLDPAGITPEMRLEELGIDSLGLVEASCRLGAFAELQVNRGQGAEREHAVVRALRPVLERTAQLVTRVGQLASRFGERGEHPMPVGAGLGGLKARRRALDELLRAREITTTKREERRADRAVEEVPRGEHRAAEEKENADGLPLHQTQHAKRDRERDEEPAEERRQHARVLRGEGRGGKPTSVAATVSVAVTVSVTVAVSVAATMSVAMARSAVSVSASGAKRWREAPSRSLPPWREARWRSAVARSTVSVSVSDEATPATPPRRDTPRRSHPTRNSRSDSSRGTAGGTPPRNRTSARPRSPS